MWLSAITSIAGTFLKNKAAEKQAVHDSKMRRIDADADWETQQASASQTSWKDEWFSVILSLPLIGAVLETMPDYYKGFLGAAIAASFGMKAVSKWGSK
jgi:hypothetical protein